ncbi:MAG: pyridoxamine 5'-phosphate oxidase family protein [Microlunatus sp.]|nr:pyridoxamine 5'-phosphate oxidase family protein [Microlunatus sp.]MDN5771329.1 pyridoxamine 5'-phosphate oxidase family protein [Microlunatus sp.]MDN5803830.1 pyridoxamine 5'-phosphate oxidase family protein [Microlunatus sp.]
MTDTAQDHTQDYEQVAELISKARFAFVTTVDSDGRLVSRPLAVQDREFDGDLYFFTADPSSKTDQVGDDSHVNVSLQSGDGYLSIAGTASVTRDQGLIDELWNKAAAAWFENGREDPAVALLKVHADSAEFWTMDSPKPVALIKYAAAIAKDEQPDVGTNKTVDL